MFDIKAHGKWIILAIAAIPVIYISLPDMANKIHQPQFKNQTQQVISPHSEKPVEQPIVLLQLDALARDVITHSENITLARLQTQIETEKANEREAQKRGIKDVQQQVNATVLTEYNNTQYDTTSIKIQPPTIERISLNGLITIDNKTIAYLSLDNLQPVRVQVGDSLAQVLVTHINTKQVTLRQNNMTRTLEG